MHSYNKKNLSNYGTRYILSILKIWAVIYKNKNHNKLYLKIIIGSIHNIGIISKVCLNQCFFCCCTFFEVTILSINVLSNTWLSYLSDTYLPSPPFRTQMHPENEPSDSFKELLLNSTGLFIVHIKQNWHFQKVTIKQ